MEVQLKDKNMSHGSLRGYQGPRSHCPPQDVNVKLATEGALASSVNQAEVSDKATGTPSPLPSNPGRGHGAGQNRGGGKSGFNFQLTPPESFQDPQTLSNHTSNVNDRK